MKHPSQTIPQFFTESPAKRAFYSSDIYFRESYEDLVITAGDSLEHFCRNHALLLLKPDAIVTRQTSKILQWVINNGFKITGAALVYLNRHAIRALWQYVLNTASRDHIDAVDLHITAGNCLLLILAFSEEDRLATLALTQAKGPASPAACRPGQLRYDIGSVNYQLNLVHGADEPADMVRELGVLCERDLRVDLIRLALSGADSSPDAYHLAKQAEATTPEVNLDLSNTLLEISAGIDAISTPNLMRQQVALASLITEIRTGNSRNWRYLLMLADACNIEVTCWQRIILATHLLNPYLSEAG